MVEAGKLLQNRYLIQKQIGAGGMGTVYVATDQRFNSPVAIKETLFDEDYLQHAFEREAQLLNSLRHPALPHVIDYFAENGRQYLVMEYFAGEDLSEILKQKRVFAVDEVLGWADDLLDALDYLHSQQTPVVHRDIKPQNLKLTARREIILLDFGLAKGKTGEASQISRTHSVFGYSRNYAPLEQIQGTGTDTRSDIYSLGATIYHLLTGKPPVDALTRATTFVSNQPDPLVPANVLNPKIPISVAEVIHQALNLNPDLRPQTAAQMQALLQKVEFKTEVANPEDTKISTANENILTTAVVNSAFSGNLGKVNNSYSPEISVVSGKDFVEKSFEQPSSAFAVSNTKRRSSLSLGKSLNIAAAILILGGGCFAAWYATSQRSKSNTPTVNSSSVAADLPAVKPSVSNVKTEEKVIEKTEGKNLNSKAGANTIAIKSTELSNKTAPPRAAEAEAAHEERPYPIPTAPIIVKSAPRTKDLKQTDEEENTDTPDPQTKKDNPEPDDSEDVIDTLRKQKKANDQPDEDRIDRRERRASPNRRRKQKLPTLLGAPQR
jgi:serine/threonine protein kinase